MTTTIQTRTPDQISREMRDRLSRVRVLLADRDHRTASLVNRILFSFGFRRIDVATHGEEVLTNLRSRPYDLIITEWNMEPTDGVALVREIRSAREDKRIRRDIPIIMLTAYSEREYVEAARDAGITEFIVKPFTTRTISNRILQVIDNPRAFIETGDYAGPCRRRRETLPPGVQDRRTRRAAVATKGPRIDINNLAALRDEAACIDWARDGIRVLQGAFNTMKTMPGDRTAHKNLLDASYAIKAQAELFGYDLGTGISSMLVNYLVTNPIIRQDKLTVVGKHIDAIVVIFNEQIKETGRDIGEEIISSLRQLIKKLG
jgi:DNA-binding response OmpR family regulator